MPSVPSTEGAASGLPVPSSSLIGRGWTLLRELAHGFRVAWISTVSVVAGIALFLMAPQAQDLFLEVRGNVAAGALYWITFYLLVMLEWMFPVYVSARWILWRFRDGATAWTQEAPVADWVRRILPRLLVTGCLFAVLLGQMMALMNAPTILDEGLEKSRAYRLETLMQSNPDCIDIQGVSDRGCILRLALKSLPQYVSHSAIAYWGSGGLIVRAYLLLTIFIFYALLRRWLIDASPATTPIAMKIGGWVLWLIAGFLKVIAGLVVFFLMFILSALLNPSQSPTVLLQTGAALFVGFFLIAFATVWAARRLGWKLRHGLFSAASNLMLAVPFSLGLAMMIYGFSINEFESAISLGHLAVLPAITMVLMWATWRMMTTGDADRATWLGQRLMRLMGHQSTSADEATARLVNPLFYGVVMFSLFLGVALAFVHPVDATRQLHRALLLPVVLGFLVPAFTWLSWYSFRQRAPFVMGLVLVTGLLIPAWFPDAHDIRTVPTSAAPPTIEESVRQWVAANDCILVRDRRDNDRLVAQGCPQPIIISAAGGASRAAFLVGGLVGKLIDETRIIQPIGHSDKVRSVSFSPDGSLLISGSMDKTARVWNVQTGAQVGVLVPPSETPVTGVLFDPTGQRALGTLGDNDAVVWSVPDGRVLQILKAETGKIEDANWSTDGRFIAIGYSTGAIRMWPAATPDSGDNPAGWLFGRIQGLKNLTFGPDGRHLAATSSNGSVLIWTVPEGAAAGLLEGHTKSVEFIRFDPTGTRAVTSSFDGTARVWEFPSGKLLAVLSGHTRDVNDARFSHDGKRIVTASDDGTVRVWDAESGRQIVKLEGSTRELTRASFNADDTRVLAYSTNRRLNLWDFQTGKLISQAEAHTITPNDARFSVDGRFLATGSDDATVKIWSMADGQLLHELRRDWIPGEALRPFQKQLFALSGVSGGALGSVVSYAALADSQDPALPREERGKPPCRNDAGARDWFAPHIDRQHKPKLPWGTEESWRSCLQTLVAGDFLSPVFHSLNRDDLLSIDHWVRDHLGWKRRGDRAAILEESWEMRYAELTRRRTEGADPLATSSTLASSMVETRLRVLKQKSDTAHWLPILLLNGTSVNTGRRIIASDIKTTSDIFQDSAQLSSLLATGEPQDTGPDTKAASRRDIRLSTGATMSARFPVISPHGTIRDPKTGNIVDRVVDGGYYENFGATTTIELVRALKDRVGLEPFVILINNEPSTSQMDCISEATGSERSVRQPRNITFSTFSAPLGALFGTRGARGSHAAVQLCNEVGARNLAYITVRPDKNNPGKQLSMSWWLSKHVQKYLDDQLEADSINAAALGKIQRVRQLREGLSLTRELRQ